MRLRVLLISVLLGVLLPAAATACEVAAGQYVVLTLEDKPKPAVVLSVAESGSTCIAEYRTLVAPGEPFDPYESSMLEEFLVGYDGPLANTNPYGCPYAPGQAADFRAESGAWLPALIAQSDRSCSYELDYFDGAVANRVTLSGFEHDRLRPATLDAPTPEQQAAAQLCPPGGALEDFAGDGEDSRLKRAVIADISAREKAPVSLSFESVREGQAIVVADGGTFLANNPDAAIGGEVRPFRIVASVCRQTGERPVTTRHTFDYNCFTDKFGDFVCRREAER